MKSQGSSNQKCATVKKFRYVSPENNELSPQPLITDDTPFNFDNVWSIRKNISVDLKATKHTGAATLAPTATKSDGPGRNSFYSRYQSNNLQLASSDDGKSQGEARRFEQKKVHHSGYKGIGNVSTCAAGENKFALDYPASSSNSDHKFGQHEGPQLGKGLPSSKGNGENFGSRYNNRSYSSKYNSAFYTSN